MRKWNWWVFLQERLYISEELSFEGRSYAGKRR
jgi:hypothetical protein